MKDPQDELVNRSDKMLRERERERETDRERSVNVTIMSLAQFS